MFLEIFESLKIGKSDRVKIKTKFKNLKSLNIRIPEIWNFL